MTMGYHDLAWPIELLRDIPLLTLHLEGDAVALDRLLPAPLRPHPARRVVLNLWVADQRTVRSGFGAPSEPLGVGYLAAEVAGAEGRTADGAATYPGRFWLRHWCSHASARDYAKRTSGLVLEPATITLRQEGERLHYALRGEDGSRIDATVTVAGERSGSTGARSVYYARRSGPDGPEIAQFDIPSAADAFEASAAGAFCAIVGRDGGIADGEQRILSAGFRRMSMVPYVARGRLGD